MAKKEKRQSDLPDQNSMVRHVLDCLWIEAELGPKPDLRLAEVYDRMRAALLLTTEDRKDGRHKRVKSDESRIRHALHMLRDGGLAESPKKGTYRITRGGRQVAESKVTGAQIASVLVSAHARSAGPTSKGEGDVLERLLSMAEGENVVKADASLTRTQECQALLCMLAPEGSSGNYMFEKIAARIATEVSGFKCKLTRRSHDEGIDGEGWNGDELAYYMQAKRYSGAERVANPPVQQLVGCCVDEAPVGYFVTTTTFADSAKKVIRKKRSVRVIPVDGREVSRVMFERRMGFSEDGSVDFGFYRRLLK